MKPDLKEINTRLAEGLECKELLTATQLQVTYLDSLNTIHEGQLSSLQAQLTLTADNGTLDSLRYEQAAASLSDCAAAKNKEVKAKRAWRTFSFIEAAGIAVLIALNKL